MNLISGGFYGVVQIDSEKWREQRRFSLHVLRDFGVGRALMEDKIMHEVDILTKHLSSLDSQTIGMTQPLAVCIGNIINNMLFGKTFEHVSSAASDTVDVTCDNNFRRTKSFYGCKKCWINNHKLS